MLLTTRGIHCTQTHTDMMCQVVHVAWTPFCCQFKKNWGYFFRSSKMLAVVDCQFFVFPLRPVCKHHIALVDCINLCMLKVCQTLFTSNTTSSSVYGAYLTKMCAPKSQCEAAEAKNSETCVSYKLKEPSCTKCCSGPFCNYDNPVLIRRKNLALLFFAQYMIVESSDGTASIVCFVSPV